ncbi:glucosylceramidase-like protein, partial [Leptotrombidium deliense]
MYTYDDVSNGTEFELKHFKLAEEDIKFRTRKISIPIIKSAISVAADKISLFGSAWGPPAWMKTNNGIKDVAELKGSVDGPYYKTWARYAVKFLESYRSHGIEMWGMTAENEPLSARTHLVWWNSLGFTAETQRDFIKLHLGPALAKSGYTSDKFHLMIFDDQLPLLPKFAEKVYADNDASKYISRAAFHWYANYLNAYALLEKVHQKFPDKFLLATEACEGSIPGFRGVRLGSWSRLVSYAMDIMEDLNNFAAGWVDWNIALELNGGPNWAENFVDAPIIVNKEQGEYCKNPMFYAMGHFSKFIKRSSRRVQFKEQ